MSYPSKDDIELLSALEKSPPVLNQKNKTITIKGEFIFPKGVKFKNLPVKPTIDNCYIHPAVIGKGIVYNKDGNKFAFKANKGSEFCIGGSIIPGYQIIAESSKVRPKPSSYENQLAGVNCQNKKSNCPPLNKKYDSSSDSNYILKYVKTDSTPEPTPTSTPKMVHISNVILAEDPNFSVNLVDIPITSNPQTVEYSLSNTDLGTKFVYAKFIATNGEEQIFKDFVNLVSPSPSPTPITYPFSINRSSVEDTINKSISPFGPGVTITNNTDSAVGIVISNESETTGIGLKGGSTAVLPGRPLIIESIVNNSTIPNGVYTGKSLIRYSIGNGPLQDGPVIPFTITLVGSTVTPSPTASASPTSNPI